MNVSNKYLTLNYLKKEKQLFYQKLSSKYTMALTKYHKKKQNKINNYKEEVLRWLFSLNIQNRMIICSVENKLYTNIFKRLYSHSQVNCNYIYKLFLEREDYQQIHKKNEANDIENNFINEIRFYQCESSMTNYELYSNYFTLSQSLLEDEKLFRHYFNKISKNKCFTVPIKTDADITSESSYDNAMTKSTTILLPDWIENEATLSEYFVALFEQAISIRYIINASSQLSNLNEIYCSSYLRDLFERKLEFEKYLDNVNALSYFDYFNIERLVKELYNDQKLAAFISSKPSNAGKTKGWFANPMIFNHHNDLNKDIEKIRKWLDELLTNRPKEIINDLMFFHISKLFIYDDFLFRGIIEAISYKYHKQNIDDLLLLEESDKIKDENNKTKKKKKSKKKSKETLHLYYITKIVLDLINTSVIHSIKKSSDSVLKYSEDKSDIKKTNKSNERVKPLFLFNSIKSEKAKEKKNKEKKSKVIVSITSTQLEGKEFQQMQVKDIQIVHNENSSYIQRTNKYSNDVTIHNYDETINKAYSSENNIIALNNSNIKNNINKYSFMFLHHNDRFGIIDKLNADIEQYYLLQEEFLFYHLKIKYIIKDYISDKIKKVNPDSIVQMFGSCQSGLDIEYSDLDLSITNLDMQINLSDYLSCLTTSNLFDSVIPVFTATVPVIKLKLNPFKLGDEQIPIQYNLITNLAFYKEYLLNKEEIKIIKIDLSLNTINYKQMDFITNSLTIYPEIKGLVKIMKRLLQLNNLNNSYHGGLCSYSLFLLIYSYVKWYSICITNKTTSIGEMLIELLMHYGFMTDFSKILIDPTLTNPFVHCYQLDYIPTILDPISLNNSAKSSFNIFSVTEIFKKAYQDVYSLPENCNYIHQLFLINHNQSISSFSVIHSILNYLLYKNAIKATVQ